MPDIQKIKELLLSLEEKTPTGFAIAFHIRFTTPDFLFQTYPKDWIDLYSEKGWVMSDPIVRWGFTETGTTRWSALAGLDDQGILAQATDYGMEYGVAIADDTGGSRSFAGFARSDREFTDEEVADLEKTIRELHSATASDKGMSDDLRDELHALSVKMTHPPSPKA